ncbi:hypothetical protein P154DRAFT_521340 [Amniculicola lignicola CBS 123094]|uniref:Phosphoglycerate mutase-like protein n=1 Tax=Amniculicola lignicola CBS 123094 TaxID=1392246 RepID=A0A6A5WM73_9PLEO|nr:hypothetical protein P154DRAFT_521340 [Amniculicola lignicola CBS 123094]
MAKGPDVVIIARHGARLDAADKTWHLSTPTPYDPPLTWGGWTQSKALGLRIAALLHAREKEKEAQQKANAANGDLAHLTFSALDYQKGSKEGKGTGSPKKTRKYKVVIHSSPYLRCIQTSTAIAAGMSQYQPPTTSLLDVPQPPNGKNDIDGSSPLSQTAVSLSPLSLPAPVRTPSADPKLQVYQKKPPGPPKILLRIDAFLGEWLSPDYFEDITPPPNSTLMVASAKADLLRRGEYIEVQHNVHNSKGHFPGGWVKSNAPSAPAPTSRTGNKEGSFPAMGSLAQALPLHRERASSQGGGTRSHSPNLHRTPSSLNVAHITPSHIYDPPAPTYSVSPADPIPRGYVAHARDACIDPDFQWDSVRAPQDWGDGGEYGDEWSTMHKRFRKGVAGMLSWYKEHGVEPPKERMHAFTYREDGTKVGRVSPDTKPVANGSEEDDEELVLILVTHGAGCNALLGAISNQPILVDVSVASLSLFAKREEPRRSSITAHSSALDIGVTAQYDMKLLASTDHLRPGVDPSKPPQAQSPAVTTIPSLDYRRRFTSSAASSPLDSMMTFPDMYRGLNSSLGSIRRSSTSGSSSSRVLSNNTTIPTSRNPSNAGLWGSSGFFPSSSQETLSGGDDSPGRNIFLNFDYQKPKINTNVGNDGHTNGDKKHEENDDVPPLQSGLGKSTSGSQSGLWTPKSATIEKGLWGQSPTVEVNERDKGPKRRWTVSEQD